MGEFIFIIIFVIIGLVLLGLLDELKTGVGDDEYQMICTIICILGVIFFSMFVIMIYNFSILL